MKIRWVPREPPLRASAVHAQGDVARLLALNLRDRSERVVTSPLSAVATDRALIILGAEEALPWVDGVTYLGRPVDAPGLYVPTLLQPTVPAGLLLKAVLTQFQQTPPVAVLPHSAEVFGLSWAKAVTKDAISGWLEQFGAASPDNSP